MLKKQATRGNYQPQFSTFQERQKQASRLMQKEAALSRVMQSEMGLRKIAANMANPVRQRLDYKGIFRKFVVVEQMPDGVPLIYDKDLPEVPALKIGKGGSVRMVEMAGRRVELEPFEIAARPKIPYKELYVRRFRALDRAKDRLIEGMELREDLIGFGLINTASTIVNTLVDGSATIMDRDHLARAFTEVERHRLVVSAILMSPYGTQGLRRWLFQELDQVGMQEVRESGYLGSMWGADFYVSDQITAGYLYILTTPKFLGWMPIRKDVDVIPADDPDNLRLGMVGYELIGLTIHNARGVAVMTHSITA